MLWLVLLLLFLGFTNALDMTEEARQALIEGYEGVLNYIVEFDLTETNKTCADLQAEVTALCAPTTIDMAELGSICGFNLDCTVGDPTSSGVFNDLDGFLMVESDEVDTIMALPSGAWNLDRIDQRDLPLSNSNYDPLYKGNGQLVYVLDSGVSSGHPDLAGRHIMGPSFINGESDSEDGHSHGSHCAGTVAGSKYGAAPQATVVGVKVLSARGSGTLWGIIKGVEWSTKDAASRGVTGVISMSLGGKSGTGKDKYISEAAKSMVVVVAAGNSADDARYYSPARNGGNARKGGCITVGSTTKRDQMSGFSNYGRNVDIFAPGSDIKSHKFSSGYTTMSGTSMACPLVAGVMAQLLEKHGGDKLKAQQELMALAIPDKLSNGKEGSLLLQIPKSTDTSPTPAPTSDGLPEPVLVVDKHYFEWYLSTFSVRPKSKYTRSGPIRNAGGEGCSPFPSNFFQGAIALIDRGGCKFVDKAENAEKAGAIALLIVQDSRAVPFSPQPPEGFTKIFQFPVAMISKADGAVLKSLEPKTLTWGLDPKFGITNPPSSRPPTNPPTPEPTSPPVTFPTVPPTKRPTTSSPTKAPVTRPTMPPVRPGFYDRYFQANSISGRCYSGRAARHAGKVLVLWYSAFDANDCAEHCIFTNGCVYMNYRPRARWESNCQLFSGCDTISTGSTELIGYSLGFKRNSITSQPTPAAQTVFDKYFKLNGKVGRKCLHNKGQYYIERSLNIGLEECAERCSLNSECIFINYDYDPVTTEKCDLIKNKCVERSDDTITLYQKVLTDGTAGDSRRQYAGTTNTTTPLWDRYFNGTVVSNAVYACETFDDTEVLEKNLELSKEDCAERCLSDSRCRFINYDDYTPLACTTLQQCNLVVRLENEVNVTSYAKIYASTGEEDADDIDPLLNWGTAIGFITPIAIYLTFQSYVRLLDSCFKDYSSVTPSGY